MAVGDEKRLLEDSVDVEVLCVYAICVHSQHEQIVHTTLVVWFCLATHNSAYGNLVQGESQKVLVHLCDTSIPTPMR